MRTVAPQIAWTSATLVSTNTNSIPYVYTFNIDFEIKLDNIGSEDLYIAEFEDLVPLGFNYSSMDFSGDITDSRFSTNIESETGREELNWRFSPDVTVTSGTFQTLKYTAVAAVTRGNYWDDLLTVFGDGDFPRDKYTWPTAMIAVRDVFINSATAANDGKLVANLHLNVAGESGSVSTWDLP